MSLSDIVYVDQERLDQYAEQLLGPSMIEKIASWKVGLGLTGVSVEGSQSGHARAFTISEKLDALQQHLGQRGLLHRGRWTNKDHQLSVRRALPGPMFCSESCLAAPLRIPANVQTGTSGLRVWYSRPVRVTGGQADDAAGPLYLLEATPKSDAEFCNRMSSYSLLAVLAKALHVHGSSLSELSSPLVQLMSSYPPKDVADPLELALSSSAIQTFTALGAQVDPPRRIEVLYRPRHVFVPIEALDAGPATVAYPICIRSI